jgi:hypothetical protein
MGNKSSYQKYVEVEDIKHIKYKGLRLVWTEKFLKKKGSKTQNGNF